MAHAGAAEATALFPEDPPCIYGTKPPHPGHLDLDQLRSHIDVKRHRLTRHQYLYHAGQPFRSLYMVNAGSVKTCELASDGREHVSGFSVVGDLVGSESLGLGTYVCDVIALETSDILELPYRLLLGACLLLPELQIRLTAALAGEIRRYRLKLLSLATLSAPQRVAVFLLELAARYQALGYSGSHFILRMSRKDMASHLGVQHETVSRVLRHLADIRCITVERKEIHILDHVEMALLAGRSGKQNSH